MIKKNLKKVAALALCVLTASSTVACGGGGSKRDPNVTHLDVFHIYAGFGNAWIKELEKNFEAAYANYSFEDNKTGVDLHITGDMKDFTASDVKNGSMDVYFFEGPDNLYSMIVNGALEPLTDIMTTPNASDNNKTLVGKMTQQQKSAYSYENEYYALPHYSGGYGIIYNKGLFDEKGFYLADKPDGQRILISATNPKKGCGPDGKYDTEDDGLPRTYDEFFDLCYEINESGAVPICFPGAYKDHHLNNLMDTLVANYEGTEQMQLNRDFSGVANNLVVFDEEGEPIFENGELKVESKEITEDNGYLLSRQAGKYYAADFINRLLDGKSVYLDMENGYSTDDTTDHYTTQQYFLNNGHLNKEEPIAMLIDGTWWQMEADGVFSHNVDKHGAEWSKDARNFGWMPLPHATESKAAEAAAAEAGTPTSVYNDYCHTATVIKAGLPEGEKAAAKALLSFAYTDENLAKFTYTTGTLIAMDYYDVLDVNELNAYEESLVNYAKKSEKSYPISNNGFFHSNHERFTAARMYAGYSTYNTAADIFLNTSLTTKEYFISYQNVFKNSVSKWKDA